MTFQPRKLEIGDDASASECSGSFVVNKEVYNESEREKVNKIKGKGTGDEMEWELKANIIQNLKQEKKL